MFSKANKNAQKESTGSQMVVSNRRSGVPSIISANLRITGDVYTEGDVQLEGYVDGDVESKSLTLGESAVVHGSIRSDTVRISGTVHGKVTGRLVELTSSAKVIGDINHGSLAIEAGAYVNGLCRHLDADEQQAQLAADAKKPSLVLSKRDSQKRDKKPSSLAARAAALGNRSDSSALAERKVVEATSK